MSALPTATVDIAAALDSYLARMNFTSPVTMADLAVVRDRLRARLPKTAQIEIVLRGDRVEISAGPCKRSKPVT